MQESHSDDEMIGRWIADSIGRAALCLVHRYIGGLWILDFVVKETERRETEREERKHAPPLSLATPQIGDLNP